MITERRMASSSARLRYFRCTSTLPTSRSGRSGSAIRSGAAADGRSAPGRRAPRSGIHDARANVICPWFR